MKRTNDEIETLLAAHPEFDWALCTHDDFGNVGCRVCDLDHVRVYQRFEWLLVRQESLLNAAIEEVARRQSWAKTWKARLNKVQPIINAVRALKDHGYDKRFLSLFAALEKYDRNLEESKDEE